MAKYLSNAFSLSMLPLPSVLDPAADVRVRVKPITEAFARNIAGAYTSVVGHQDTASLFSSVLGIQVPMNRVTTKLSHGDCLLVGQYMGPRLPEGTTTLPEGASIQWMIVEALGE